MKGRAMLYTFTAAADNYEPVPRNYLRGTLETFHRSAHKSDVLLIDNPPNDAHKAIYVLDFGAGVKVRYVAGWNGEKFFLQPFPLSVGTRPDNGRPVDMSGWMLGPRRAFHLKLKEV
jgi:hypothetical protein